MKGTTPIVIFCALTLCASALSACGGGGRVVEPDEKVKAAPAPEEAPDYFRDFAGTKVPLGQPFDLVIDPVGVEGVEVVVRLLKVDESSWEKPGGEEVVETTALIEVRKGDQTKKVSIDQGQSKAALGCTIEVLEAKVEFYEPRADYIAQSRVKVTR